MLATLLVLSASPAQAFGPQGHTVYSEQGAEVEAIDEAEQATQEAEPVEDSAEAVEESTPNDAAESTDEIGDDRSTADEAAAEVEAATPTDEASAPEEGVAAAEADEITPADGAITETPDTIELSGRVVILPDEIGIDPEGAASDAALVGGVLIATDNGEFVPVDAADLNEPISGDSEFEGVATLSASAQTAVSARLEAEGALSEAQVLETVNQVVLDEESTLSVSGEVTGPVQTQSDVPLGAAPAKKKHSADVVYFGGASNSRKFTEGSLKSLVSQTSAYWKTQSNGAVDGLTVRKFKSLPRKTSACVPATLWSEAAKYFKATSKTYTNGHHLIVVADSRYGCSGGAGLAGIGTSIHSGGEVWVDLAGWSQPSDAAGQATVNKSLSTLAHEVGHNLSLGHSQSRVCSGRTIDAPTTWKDDEQNRGVLRVLKPSGSKCQDVEYGNSWDLMGHANSTGNKPAALGIAQRSALGVNPSGSVRTVQATGGRVQNFTLNPLGNNAGLRGLKVINPQGESFFVEYRSKVGQDSKGPNRVYSADGTTAVTTGVLVSKSYPSARFLNGYGKWVPYAAKRSTALTNYRTAGSDSNMKHLTLIKGGTTVPISSTAKVRVTNIAGGKATVRVEFTPFIDVAYDRKFAKEINWMSSSKLSTGTKVGKNTSKYLPSTGVTREAMAAFLYRLNTPAGKKAPAGYKVPKVSPFADMKPGDKFYKEIAWMYTSKLSTGTKQASGKPKYFPKAGVTREAMSAFLYRMDKKKKPATLKISPFADMTPKTKFYKEISWMYRTGLSTGTKQKTGKPKYLPKDTVSREAMAAFIYRYKH